MVIQNGRVRAGYHVGAIVDADAVVHFIGERPGTASTRCRRISPTAATPAGRSRWSSDLDHSSTTAVCGIHPDGKPPAEAVEEIAWLITRIVKMRQSGIGLGA